MEFLLFFYYFAGTGDVILTIFFGRDTTDQLYVINIITKL